MSTRSKSGYIWMYTAPFPHRPFHGTIMGLNTLKGAMDHMNVTDDMLHPELRKQGKRLRKLSRFYTKKNFMRIKKVMPLATRFMKVKGLFSSQTYITTPDTGKLRLCVYANPTPKPEAIGLLWIHGGGYAIGSPEQDTAFVKNFMDTANCVVVSPDYTLSVDAPYPAAVNDCYNALLWMRDNSQQLGIRPDQLFVGGDSAGGGLAAAVTLMARDKGEVSVAFQMPLYPMLDDRMTTPSAQNNNAPVWNSAANEIGWQLYLGELFGTDAVPSYAAPARELDFSKLPPAYSLVGSIEPFCDETKEYFAQLNSAGVEATLDVYPGCFHAFDMMCAKTQVAQEATAACLKAFLYAASHYYAPQPEHITR